jgi:hypothetical protein
MFRHCVYPKSWTEGIIIPVYKKGEKKQAENDRPITLVSIFSKVFSNLINNRLLNWAEANDKLSPFQYGFRKNRSTVDAIYVLHGIIKHTLNNKEKLYCCFVDFEKAFDRINHKLLWYKLFKQNCSAKVLNMIKAIYNEVKICIRVNKNTSDFFNSNIDVKQGSRAIISTPVYFVCK